LFFPVLTDKQQQRLVHHQAKLAKSHTFYKPHETETHHAFPLRLLVAVVLLLDLHSCLQISLGAVTWGIPYAVRPAAATTTILCCSIATNALAGLLIALGDRRTRKKDVLERLLKQELTAEVMDKMRKKKEKEARREEAGRNGEGVLGGVVSLPSWSDVKRKSSEEKGRTSGDSNGGGDGGGGDEEDEDEDDRVGVMGASAAAAGSPRSSGSRSRSRGDKDKDKWRKKKKKRHQAGRFDAAVLGRVSEEGSRSRSRSGDEVLVPGGFGEEKKT